MSETIRYIQRKEIDVDKWDACVEAAPNGLIYARSWWLDAMADNWDALVLGDYEIIMPLTWRRKWGIKYLYQPAFTQQLGIISSQALNVNDICSFYTEMQSVFRFAEINLNFLNSFDNTSPRQNFILDLRKRYNEIAALYKNDLKKNLHRSIRNDFTYDNNIQSATVIEAFKFSYNEKIKLSASDFVRLNEVAKIAGQKNMVITRAVKNSNGDLSAAVLCFKDNKRIYFLLSVTPATARVHRGNHFLVDRLVKEFSEQPLLLDFEGSDLEGIAYFYQLFGAVDQPYPFLRFNHLPWPVSLLKR